MSFKLGKWLVICDRCGFRRHNDQVMKTWDGYIVCAPSTGKTCYETRHPQEFIRSKPDNTSVPFVRPEPALVSQAPSFDCSYKDFRWVDRSLYNTLTSNYTVDKEKTMGPITIPDGITISVTCEWTIV